MIYRPIWKDTFYEVNAERLIYTIRTDGIIIYSGKAYSMPSEGSIRINVNKICQNYLDSDIQALLEGNNESMTMDNAVKTFTLNDENGNVLETYMFLNIWDKDTDWSGQNIRLSAPIDGCYAANMLTLHSKFVRPSDATTQKHFPQDYTKLVCADYAVYYLNSLGGWDSFAIQGNAKKSDTITQYTMDRAFDNTTLDYEADRYISEIIGQYELSTGWLTDEQSENLANNLIGSNKVYLHNLKSDKIFPVIITDSNVTYQTYRNNGNKLCRYTIKMKESQSKIRK